MPSQNYLVPVNDFEERTFPTEPPASQEEQDGEGDEATAPFTSTTISGIESSGGGGGGEVQDRKINQSSNKRRLFNKNPFLHNNSIEGTTIYSILDGSQETTAG